MADFTKNLGEITNPIKVVGGFVEALKAVADDILLTGIGVGAAATMVLVGGQWVAGQVKLPDIANILGDLAGGLGSLGTQALNAIPVIGNGIVQIGTTINNSVGAFGGATLALLGAAVGKTLLDDTIKVPK